jgi:hypothetical protein
MVLTKETLDALEERATDAKAVSHHYGSSCVIDANELAELVLGYRVLLNLSALLDELIPQAKKN